MITFLAKMVQTCVAFGCVNVSKKNSGITFYKFPPIKRAAIREKWIHAMRRIGFQPGNYAKVCSNHFRPEDFQPSIKLKKLKQDAVPKVDIGQDEVVQRSHGNSILRSRVFRGL